jgi:hypothetical protein
MKMHTVKLVFKINAVDQDEANVKVLRLAFDGVRDAKFEHPQFFEDLDSWDLDMEHDSNER